MTWTWFHRLASPPYVYALAARLTPWFAWPAALLIAGRTVRRAGARAAGLSAGRWLSHHLRARAERVDVAHGVYDHGGRGRRRRSSGASRSRTRSRPAARRSAPRSPSPRSSPARSGASRCGALTGQWDPRLTSELILLFLYLGYMGLRAGVRGSAARRPRQRAAGGRGRGERADHSLLGDLVELAAPGALGDAAGQADHAGSDAVAAADDAARFHAVLRRGAAGAAARRGAQPRARGRAGSARR